MKRLFIKIVYAVMSTQNLRQAQTNNAVFDPLGMSAGFPKSALITYRPK